MQTLPTAFVRPWPAKEIELYEAGHSLNEIAELLGVTGRTIRRRLQGCIQLRRAARGYCSICGKQVSSPRTRAHKACLRTNPRPAPRPCEQCDKQFTPHPEKLARGAGRFCAPACWNLWRTGRPPLTDETGRRPGWRASS